MSAVHAVGVSSQQLSAAISSSAAASAGGQHQDSFGQSGGLLTAIFCFFIEQDSTESSLFLSMAVGMS